MIIELKGLIPLPLKEIDHNDSDLWEAESIIFKPGEYIFLFADSGKGKTSLLSIIYGLRKDYQGNVLLDGKDLSAMSLKELSELRKKKISYIFQGLELFDELTALENIMLKNRQTGFKSTEEIQEMAIKLGISNFMHRKAGILSFGQKQRVAIIRALCQPFEFLLADEVFSHLDRNIRENGFDLLREELEKQKAGLLFTSLGEHKNNPIFTNKYRV